jgi:hypothetical protein
MDICIGLFSLPGGFSHVRWETKRAVPVPDRSNLVEVFVSEEELIQEFDEVEMSLLRRGWHWIAR